MSVGIAPARTDRLNGDSDMRSTIYASMFFLAAINAHSEEVGLPPFPSSNGIVAIDANFATACGHSAVIVGRRGERYYWRSIDDGKYIDISFVIGTHWKCSPDSNYIIYHDEADATVVFDTRTGRKRIISQMPITLYFEPNGKLPLPSCTHTTLVQE